MSTHPSPYCVTAPDSSYPLRQGEFLTKVTLGRQTLETLGSSQPEFSFQTFVHSVILSQDCDLEQDHRVRFPAGQKPSDKLLSQVLLAELYPAEQIFGIVKTAGGNKAWDRVRQNNDPRYHFLEGVPFSADRINEGLPELVMDFKRFFTVPIDELYQRIDLTHTVRRCVMVSPYLEHLSDRFAYYLSRIGLPIDHFSL